MDPKPDMILSPFTPGFNPAAFGDRTQCNHSGCENYGAMKCSRCHSARYCSKECQVADWKEKHKHTCQHPTTESTFIGEIPSSWTHNPTASPGTSSGPVPGRNNPRLVYNDTNRGKSVDMPSINSMASRPSLRGYSEYYSGSTDGSFFICISNGDGAFLSKKFYNSIPSAHRPTLNLRDAGKTVHVLYSQTQKTLGSVMMPVILKTADTNEWIKLILYAFVLPNPTPNPMFISWKALVSLKPQWGIVGVKEKKMFVHFENDLGVFNIQGL